MNTNQSFTGTMSELNKKTSSQLEKLNSIIFNNNRHNNIMNIKIGYHALGVYNKDQSFNLPTNPIMQFDKTL